jgi:hypothetical protein
VGNINSQMINSSSIQYLRQGEFLSPDFEFYASGYLKQKEAEMVGSSLVSSNGSHGLFIDLDGAVVVFSGSLPDTYVPLFRSNAGSALQLAGKGGVLPITYKLVLEHDGALRVKGGAQTFWESGKPSSHPGTGFFAQVRDDGNLVARFGTPEHPGEVYWELGVKCRAWVRITKDLDTHWYRKLMVTWDGGQAEIPFARRPGNDQDLYIEWPTHHNGRPIRNAKLHCLADAPSQGGNVSLFSAEVGLWRAVRFVNRESRGFMP